MSTLSVKIARCAIAMIATATLGCAAKPPMIMLAGPPDKCSGPGFGLASPPTPVTRDAMSAQNEADKLGLDALHEQLGRGEVTAQIALGLKYVNGIDVPKDSDRALALLTAAYGQGNPIAAFYLSAAHSNGFGVPKDETLTVMYLEEAARQGYPIAQYWLALMVAGGRGGIQANWCAAVPLLEAAALQDISDAALQLGIIYHRGLTGDPNYDTAARWYRQATSKTLNQMAQYNLRNLIETRLIDWREGDPGKPLPDNSGISPDQPTADQPSETPPS